MQNLSLFNSYGISQDEHYKALVELYRNKSLAELNEELVCACAQGDYDVVYILLLSPELERHADATCDNLNALSNAIYYGNYEIVEFLVTCPHILPRPNVNKQGGKIIKELLEYKEFYLLEFFLTSNCLAEPIDWSSSRTNVDKFLKNINSLSGFREIQVGQLLLSHLEKLNLEKQLGNSLLSQNSYKI